MEPLILKIDRDGFPHVGGVRWNQDELLHNYYDSIEYDEPKNVYYYKFDKQKAEIQAFDELAIVTELNEDEAVLLGGYTANLISPIFLDYKSRPLVFVECKKSIIRALVSTSAYYEYVKEFKIEDEFPYWWTVDEVTSERDSDQYNYVMENLIKRTTKFLKSQVSHFASKSKWVFHPLSIEEDVQFIANQNHRILCCEPQKELFRRRLKLDEENLVKRVQNKIEYFNEQFAPQDNRKFDVFFDHGLVNHVFPGDRKGFQDYINNFQVSYYLGGVFLSHDFFGPPYGYTEKEFYDFLVNGLGFEPLVWNIEESYLFVLAQRAH